MRVMRLLIIWTVLLLCSFQVEAQKKNQSKYPSLFWEITGNGLQKPSYLFGTMHVSSKLVFHLNDSFFRAIKSVDAVALELNPDLWQEQMVRMDKLKQNYAAFVQTAGNEYINENSFRINNYYAELKMAMSTEPTVMNSLLYRTYKAREDFEEDTFLDLYIFQTGRKLGKRGTGVEDYFETEKLILEAYADMAHEKKKKTVDQDEESGIDINEKMQDAYRRGDLDLMDSLDKMTERSDAFREKFLYRRNEIQANSIDTIIQKSSLFVGVGAAHLAGERGVIALLRKKGYRLRPIMMDDREALQKESIDKLKVPVQFTTQIADDGFYRVDLPGPFFNIVTENQQLNRREYADMSNGAYYLVTRIKTHAAFLGQNENQVMHKVDSMLYENIPGKMLSKKLLNRNGYPGYDISSRTRRGDLQRYNLFVTPYEILVFKMSGNENYVAGEEADRFFSSIHLQETQPVSPVPFQPVQGGFTIRFPQRPSEYFNNTTDESGRWEYEAVDANTGNDYLLLKKSVNNFHFLDEDSFDLSLVEESFLHPDFIDKQLLRKQGSYNGYPCLDITEKMKDGALLRARFIIRGPHYFVIAAKTKFNREDLDAYFNSFHFAGYNYQHAAAYTDTFLHFTVNSPVLPELDGSLRKLIEEAAGNMTNGYNNTDNAGFWPKPKNAVFSSDSTGEIITVNMQEYPKHYYANDTARSWKNEITGFLKKEMILYKTDSFTLDNGLRGCRFILRDTGSSRTINTVILRTAAFHISCVCLGDTVSEQSDFFNNFLSSIRPLIKKPVPLVQTDHLDEFFSDLFSTDSALHARALQSLTAVKFGEEGIARIMSAIHRLNLQQPDYFETKSKLIAELGFRKDTGSRVVVDDLKMIFEQTADTSLFQNEVIKALARHRTKAAYALFRDLILADPPLFENSYDYNNLFTFLGDSLELSKVLFPGLLQLVSVDDYKPKVLSLLVQLVDSNIIRSADYESYFSRIYYDARIELKKQQGKDEKKMEQENKSEEGNNLIRFNSYGYNMGKRSLYDYGVLLMPFYDNNINVQKYFEGLLRSKDKEVRLDAAVLLLRHLKNVADSTLLQLATDDRYRAKLYGTLNVIHRLDKFPKQFMRQLDIARSVLFEDADNEKMDSVVFLSKHAVSYRNTKGLVYFFKYRVKKEDEWKIGISGPQPEDGLAISTDDDLTVRTDKKLNNREPLADQLQKQLKKLLFTQHKSGKLFFKSEDR